MGQVILATHGITKCYGQLEVLKGIELQVPQGVLMAIVGPSGAGKTTLLQIIGTLLAPDSGQVLVEGRDVTHLSEKGQALFRNERIGFVFQFHYLLPEFTALENVCMPMLIRGESMARAKQRAGVLLEAFGLMPRAHHKPSALSGGEQQRVAVCRALANDPPLILADEPTGNLDSANRADLYAMFLHLRDTLGKTFVVVTHDEDLAARADVVVHMADGAIQGVESECSFQSAERR